MRYQVWSIKIILISVEASGKSIRLSQNDAFEFDLVVREIFSRRVKQQYYQTIFPHKPVEISVNVNLFLLSEDNLCQNETSQ